MPDYSGYGEALCRRPAMSGSQFLRPAVTGSYSFGCTDNGTPSSENKRWFALSTHTHHEKRVAIRLRERGIETFLPTYRSTRDWSNGRKVRLDLPLLPNYLFVHISSAERVQVISTPGVVSIVGRRNNPIPVSNEEMERLLFGLRVARVEPHPYLNEGARARITAGPFAGLSGVILREKSPVRIVLSIESIKQSILIEVPSYDVMPL